VKVWVNCAFTMRSGAPETVRCSPFSSTMLEMKAGDSVSFDTPRNATGFCHGSGVSFWTCENAMDRNIPLGKGECRGKNRQSGWMTEQWNAPVAVKPTWRKTTKRKQIMEVRALTKNVRISPEKARHVSRLIQGKSVVEALAIVELSPRKAAALIGKTLRSAIANAENNCDVNRKALTVKAALVSPGPIIRRFRPKARGSAGRIRKRTSHVEVVLTDI